MGITEAKVRKAFKAHEDFFKENLETVTKRVLRRKLEEHLDLEEDGLKPFKQLLDKLIEELVNPEEDDEPETAPNAKAKAEKKEKEKKRKSSGSDAAEAAPSNKPRQYGKQVEKLKNICKQATIVIPPTFYVKNKIEADLITAIKTLLRRHELEPDASAHEIAKVKQKLQMQRDLDGIDTSNIVQGGRRSRQPTSYKQILKLSSASSESEEEEEEDSDEDCVVEEDGSDEAEQDSDTESEDKKAKKQKHISPNENAARNTASKGKAPASAEKAGPSRKSPKVKKQTRVVDWSDDDE